MTPNSKKKILFIDDENIWCAPYITFLQKEFVVVYRDSAKEGLEYFTDHPEIDCIVLDIMMPTPTGVSPNKTADGDTTGAWLLAEMSGMVKANKCPVIVLTNRRLADITDQMDELGLDSRLIGVYRKADVGRKRLPEVVGRMIALNMG